MTNLELPEPVTQHTAAVATGIIGALARLIGDKCMAHRQSLQGQIDSKLRAKINEKKQALGYAPSRPRSQLTKLRTNTICQCKGGKDCWKL